MKITIRTARPRNPLVPLARRRHAGRHERTKAALRQRDQLALKRELERLRPER